MTTTARSATTPSVRRLLVTGVPAGLAVAVVQILLVVAVRAAGTDVVAPVGGEVMDLPLGAILVIDLLAGLAGALGAAAISRRARRPARTVAVTGAVLTLVSLVPVWASGIPVSSALVLTTLHLTTGAVVVGALVRLLPRAPSTSVRPFAA